MNVKLLILFSVLLLRSCGCGVTGIDDEHPIIWYPPYIKFCFTNQTADTIYIWDETIFGDQRHEIGECKAVLPNDSSLIKLKNKGNSSIHGMMSENLIRNRLDTILVYVALNSANYNQWYAAIMECQKENADNYYNQKYVIVRSNLDDMIGASELIPIYYNGQ